MTTMVKATQLAEEGLAFIKARATTPGVVCDDAGITRGAYAGLNNSARNWLAQLLAVGVSIEFKVGPLPYTSTEEPPTEAEGRRAGWLPPKTPEVV